MRWRQFIVGIGAAMAAPFGVSAQQQKVWRIGFLSPGRLDYNAICGWGIMRRREFLAALGATFAPVDARAQQTKAQQPATKKRIAIVYTSAGRGRSARPCPSNL
jgi:hypothetical protein